jgi:cytochrome c oxidase cbb3-type subunit 4
MFANIHAWWTVALLATFIGIVVWAYSSTRKQEFDEAARLALDDDDETISSDRRNGDAHG